MVQPIVGVLLLFFLRTSEVSRRFNKNNHIHLLMPCEVDSTLHTKLFDR